MNYTYEVIEIDQIISSIKRTDENGLISWIPIDGGNSDYQAYLNRESEQSTPIVGEHLTKIIPD